MGCTSSPLGESTLCLLPLNSGTCASCVQRLYKVGPLLFPRRECKQIPEETTWLSSFRACCNWRGLKEFSKLYLCQGKCK